MALNLAGAAMAAAAALAAWGVQANFEDSAGFSGQAGATCIACHTTPHPTRDDAHAILEGLPMAWEPGKTYALTVRVEGGPPALGAPQPQGGFDLAVSAGTLAPAAGHEGLVTLAKPTEATYTAQGSLTRQWNLTWTAPELDSLDARPGDVHAWLAVLAADGNHLVAAGLPDGGERFDSADHLRALVPAAPIALTQWEAMPLPPPSMEASPSEGTWLVEGRHATPLAQSIEWRLDGSVPKARATGPAWSLRLDVPGGHVLEVRSVGEGRASPWVAFEVPYGAAGTRDAPLALGGLALSILCAAWCRRG